MGTSMRDDFEAAMDSMDSGSEEVEEITEEITELAMDDGIVEDSENLDEGQEPTETTAASTEVTAAPDGASEADTPPASKDSMKAPVGWSPKDREDWSMIPRHLQERISAREKEMSANMANTKASRQTHDTIQRMGQQYGQIMQAEGVSDPMQAIDGMFQQVARLRMGSPQEKAHLLASMVEHYGVDIGELDNALTQSPSMHQADPQQQAMERMLNQRMAPMEQLMQGVNAIQKHNSQHQATEAANSVKAFGDTAEFLGDVRNDMADLIDMAANQGRDMSLQEAYDKACAFHPQISNIIEQRRSDNRIKQATQGIGSKRQAASSLSGRKTGLGGQSSGMSLHDQLSSAWEDQRQG